MICCICGNKISYRDDHFIFGHVETKVKEEPKGLCHNHGKIFEEFLIRFKEEVQTIEKNEEIQRIKHEVNGQKTLDETLGRP